VVLNELVPRQMRTGFIGTLDRITSPVTDFIRGNPLVSTAAIGIGTTGLVTAVATIRRRKKRTALLRKRKSRTPKRKRKKARRVVKKGKRGKAKRRTTHRSPRHKGHKVVSFRNKKTGKMVRFLVRRKGGKSHSKRRKR